jgi:hypothetical protein
MRRGAKRMIRDDRAFRAHILHSCHFQGLRKLSRKVSLPNNGRLSGQYRDLDRSTRGLSENSDRSEGETD